MKYKKTVLKIILLTLVIIACVAGVNYIVDPLWCFDKKFAFDENQIAFDERQQKTNKITFCPFEYDTLLLGSSRTTYINQYNFKNMHVFNYAANSMRPDEYGKYIEYAKKINKKSFKRIILGLDFFGTRHREFVRFNKPEYYIEKSNSLFYRYKSLLSKDTFIYSIKNIYKKYKKGNHDGYSRVTNIRNMYKPSIVEKKKNITEQICLYKDTVYGKTYQYIPQHELFEQIKKDNYDAQFLVFITPVSKILLDIIVQQGRLEDYKRWIRDCVQIFGKIYNFMYLNEITGNMDNFKDVHHFYPEIGVLIADRISNASRSDAPSFGILVTNNNLESHLMFLSTNLQPLDLSWRKKVDIHDLPWASCRR
ncbi:hypothetical protein [Desulfoplanes formicivorans]|uniref:Uncharacterized protein n=1 Tax=Desulfoplanes formicivorans TaxID=1592317 RepID=A0A194AAY7_9BACT|nr:hypothetical protein [Desulfoplanes formicivorans]GAU07342.1 hypothetical protein DPF_0020 [Desulfoplanes formicivorans]